MSENENSCCWITGRVANMKAVQDRGLDMSFHRNSTESSEFFFLLSPWRQFVPNVL